MNNLLWFLIKWNFFIAVMQQCYLYALNVYYIPFFLPPTAFNYKKQQKGSSVY